MSTRTSIVQVNPKVACPPEILAEQVAIEVRYVDLAHKQRRGIIEINAQVSEDIQAFFAKALELSFPIETVVRASDYGWDDQELMAANATSGFNYRTIPNTGMLSNHAHGLAFDVNTRLNPYIVYTNGRPEIFPAGAVWNPDVPGTLSADHGLVKLMKSKGWTWGGDWISDVDNAIDYQHFEKPAVQSVT